jgi:hypothetical protein
MHGSPLGIKPHPSPNEGSVNEKGVVVETLTHSLNRRHGGSGHGDRATIRGTTVDEFSYRPMLS